MKTRIGLVLGVLMAGCASFGAGPLPDPAIDVPAASGKQKAVFAGGCFWCTEAVFEQLKGVTDVVSGYAGGTKETAKYEIVGAGRTDHAEAIQITFDPKKITYGQLLKVFFSTAHDPTTLNRQGPDHGRQYRSEIFAVDEEQKKVAAAYMKQLTEAKVFSAPIVTLLEPLKAFYVAEEYHQDFVTRHPDHPYVLAHAVSKIKKTREQFKELARK